MQRGGFSIIEILVVLAIAAVVFGYALGVGSEFYSSKSIMTERDNLVSILKRARSSAMSNMNQSSHGVYIATSSYVYFDGSSYATRNTDYDLLIPIQSGVTISGPGEIVFAALGGTSNTSGTITLSNGAGAANIKINLEGRIDW